MHDLSASGSRRCSFGPVQTDDTQYYEVNFLTSSDGPADLVVGPAIISLLTVPPGLRLEIIATFHLTLGALSLASALFGRQHIHLAA